MADAASVRRLVTVDNKATVPARHTAVVRITHWIITLCVFALLLTGVEITISHPRFYWGETGNVLTPSLFQLPVPASRSYVQTGYGYVLPDQNGWSCDLHFQTAWIVVFTAFLYAAFGFRTRHFRKNLLPTGSQVTRASLLSELIDHLRFKRPGDAEAWSYNALQRLAYVFVIFVLFPLMIWTGLAMSPAVAAAFPAAVTVFGGHQSARTIHFFSTVILVLFVFVHVVMVWRAGFTTRMRAMITGRTAGNQEHS